MFLRQSGWLMAGVMIAMTGCSTQQGGFLTDVNGTRIAPPATGSVHYPQTASLPDPYYNRGTGIQLPPPPTNVPVDVNSSRGWRPSGTAPVQQSPASSGLAGTPVVQIPGNNLTSASNTSGLSPNNQVQFAQATYPMPGQPGQASQPPGVGGGMRLNDATGMQNGQGNHQVANTGNGLLNRTWEYVVRPGASMPPTTPWQGNTVVVSQNSTIPAVNGQPANYTGAPYGYGNGYVPQGVIADGWRQRETVNGVPR